MFVVSTGAQAGPLFDDYLNYVRSGAGTGPGNVTFTVSSDRPVGQSFTVPANTGEVYRIGIRPVYETWNPGEKVTMTLYDSPQKKQKMGEYTIEEATSHVQVVNDTKDRVLYFQFRQPTKGSNSLYFELSAAGGDGKVMLQGFSDDKYPGGQAAPSDTGAVDIAFECHIKPVADRIANLRRFFAERLNIDRPELAAVKAAVDKGDWEAAIAETVKHFHNRMDLWAAWKDVMDVKIDPTVDTSLADLVLKGYLRNKETNQPLPWRAESDWVPEYPAEREDPAHVSEPPLALWHIDRTLGGAYTATGKEEYARKSIDLRMQYILDNPNPNMAGLPLYHEMWNDRTAGARTPGHGDLVYARFYNYKGWTNDEKMVFFSWIEDNARWDYEGNTGGNWGAEAARACLDFGQRFPEWKMSPKYVGWGAARMAEVTMDTINGDGVSHEAAIKYHAMVARRVKGTIEDLRAGKLDMDPALAKPLTQRFIGMYDHMAYALQPNSNVVMCGDSWYENYANELADVGKILDRPDFLWVASQGKEGTPPKQISKVYPQSGYFIMRSDFGGKGLNYTDARQMFIHNGGWFGAHCHWDLTSINLYGYGRTLVIDPGQYDYTPPEGFDRYWQSSIHSMMVVEGSDVKREPGPSEWASNKLVDWFDGKHFGYSNKENIDYIRRRIAFVKPYYFLVDDSAKTTRDTDWAQVWNITDPKASVDDKTKAIETTFPAGGNLMILSQDPDGLTVETKQGMTSSSDAYPETRIVRLHRRTANPRFESLLYPYKAGSRPDITWERIAPDSGRNLGDLFYSLKINTPEGVDWAAFGQIDTPSAYRGGSHGMNADFALVRMAKSGQIKGLTWAIGKSLMFNRKLMAKSDNCIQSLAVEYQGSKMTVDADESDASLAVRVSDAKSFVVNGRSIAKPVVKNGMFYPFADLPRTIVADDRDAFKRLTETNEWARVPDPNSWSAGYTHHETDLGRHENGDYIFNVPKTGTYGVEVYLPKVTMTPSDRVDYRVAAVGQPVQPGGAVTNACYDGNAYTFTLNQQAMCGWVKLGNFDLRQGQFAINSRNMTETDGLYFIADSVRLTAKKQ